MHFICQIRRQLANAGHKGRDLVPNYMNCCCFPMFITSQLIKEITPRSLVSFSLCSIWWRGKEKRIFCLQHISNWNKAFGSQSLEWNMNIKCFNQFLKSFLKANRPRYSIIITVHAILLVQYLLSNYMNMCMQLQQLFRNRSGQQWPKPDFYTDLAFYH